MYFLLLSTPHFSNIIFLSYIKALVRNTAFFYDCFEVQNIIYLYWVVYLINYFLLNMIVSD